ncbi:MAG: adenosylhomocysteinase [Candidatus Bathyarchaeia archaeon]
MTGYKVRDPSLAASGRDSIRWAEGLMPVLLKLRERFASSKPLKGIRIGACLHVTKETAVLVRTLLAGGADVSLCASNPLSTQDDVAAALAEEGVNVYAWRGESEEEYYDCIRMVLKDCPRITMDDGGDLTVLAHEEFGQLAGDILGGTEETTSGVHRIKALEADGILKYPVIAVNDAFTKYLFDNRYGTGQSAIDGIIRATGILLAGKRLVVCGYGWCGKGIAQRAKGMGAQVIVTEISPLRALEAVMDGFQVMPMEEAARIGDIFVTATGNIGVIRAEHMALMKSGAIMANAGHFDVEVDVKALASISISRRRVRPHVDEYLLRDGRKLYLLAEGRLVNLAAAEGHPGEVMMMSFSNQALSVEYLVKRGETLEPRVHRVPEELDEEVARLSIECMGIRIDEPTEEQRSYMKRWGRA